MMTCVGSERTRPRLSSKPRRPPLLLIGLPMFPRLIWRLATPSPVA